MWATPEFRGGTWKSSGGPGRTPGGYARIARGALGWSFELVSLSPAENLYIEGKSGTVDSTADVGCFDVRVVFGPKRIIVRPQKPD